jgi:hypothetical protein
MKKLSVLICIMSMVFIPALFSHAEEAQHDTSSGFSVERLVIAGSIDNREPVGVVDAFSSSTEKVYCFLEARNITADTTASFVWYHGEKELARIDLPLGKSSRWRTYSSKKLGGRQGAWKVELQDAQGAVLATATFTVE